MKALKVSEMNSILDETELLDAQVHKNVAAIPITTPPNYSFDVMTLKKGFELGLVNVKECETSTVNTIVVENKSVTPLLLIDGEEIVGGDQNRIVNATILVAPQSEMKIPVNCTEHGRWGFKHEFRESEYMANYRTRSAKAHARYDNMDEQGAVWDAIDRLEHNRSFHSPTQAMSENYEDAKSDLNKILPAFKAVDGQSGVVVIIDGEIKGFEIFANSDVYRQFHEKVLKSYLIGAEINDSVFAINNDEIRSFMDNALDCEVSESPNTGLETRFEFKNDDCIGTLYTYMEELIHLSYFASDEEKIGEKPPLVDVDYEDEVTI